MFVKNIQLCDPFPERIGEIINHVKDCVHILR